MSETLLARLRPLWAEALSAFNSDPSYAIEMARAGASLRGATDAR